MLAETAIIMPIMIFLVLGALQIMLIQHAKIMTEFGAYNAARAGIVHNANWNVMRNAVLITSLPLYGRTDRLGSPGDCVAGGGSVVSCRSYIQCWCRIKAVAELTEAVDTTIGTVENLAGDLLGINMGGLMQDISLIEVNVTSPDAEAFGTADDWQSKMESFSVRQSIDGDRGRLDYPDGEIDFDDLAMLQEHPELTRLGVEVRVLYPLKIPIINKIIFELWLAQELLSARRVNSDLQDWAQWRARLPDGRYVDEAVREVDGEGPLDDILTESQWVREVRTLRWIAEEYDIYLLPIHGSYAMQMQSNMFEKNQREPVWFDIDDF